MATGTMLMGSVDSGEGAPKVTRCRILAATNSFPPARPDGTDVVSVDSEGRRYLSSALVAVCTTKLRPSDWADSGE